ncbi:MAG: hypothetical protein IJ106_10365 [Parasporobacterium sp.]|nr:hypothetical protein [Parasporobacterium sp.]
MICDHIRMCQQEGIDPEETFAEIGSVLMTMLDETAIMFGLRTTEVRTKLLQIGNEVDRILAEWEE